VYTFAVASTLDAVRRSSPGSLQRRRAVGYAVAFGLIDSGFLLSIPSFDLQYFGAAPASEYATFNIVSTYVFLAALLVLARTMLRYQLFDLDIKVKWTLKRGTLVAIILVVFFVSTAVAEQYLQGYGFVVGGVAIGLLLFAIRPVERAIDRLADRAMPRTTGTPEYVAFRKLEVYKAAVESAHETGGITDKDRRNLERLRAKLAIGSADAEAVERDVGLSEVPLA
jgi:hypothetical protein